VKRLLQVVAAALGVLALLLVWRIAQVWKVEPPAFPPPAQVAAIDPLPPAPKPLGATQPAIEEIVNGNLFETDRGAIEPTAATGEETPLPPPTNVVLNGVFFQTTGRPMAIMTDTSAGNKQLTLQQGDNVGEYQVGKITRQGVTLLGRGGQEFSLDLAVGKTTPAAIAASVARPPTPPPAAAAAAAQSAAQRAAAARKQAQQVQQSQEAQQKGGRPVQNRTTAQVAETDPGQARLEALKRLREAATRQ
jgi:hypothetical protein